MRERIDRLFDAGSSTRQARWRAARNTTRRRAVDFLPANVVIGQGRIDGRRAVVQGDDFTVRGGAADAAIWQKMVYAERLANELGIPLVRLVDGPAAAGASSRSRRWATPTCRSSPAGSVAVENLSTVPVVAAALGPVAGLGAARVVASHFSVIVRGTAQLFVAGPPVVAAAMGETPDKEELGGARAQTRAGAVDNEAADEDDALGAAEALSLLPAVERLGGAADRGRRRPRGPPRGGAARRSSRATRASPTRCGASSSGVRPRLGLRGRARSTGARSITALARLGGRPVGVLASDPKHYGGGLTADASEKLDALRRPLRPVPAAGRQLRRPARAS